VDRQHNCATGCCKIAVGSPDPSRPIGVATFDMAEPLADELRKALPSVARLMAEVESVMWRREEP